MLVGWLGAHRKVATWCFSAIYMYYACKRTIEVRNLITLLKNSNSYTANTCVTLQGIPV